MSLWPTRVGASGDQIISGLLGQVLITLRPVGLQTHPEVYFPSLRMHSPFNLPIWPTRKTNRSYKMIVDYC